MEAIFSSGMSDSIRTTRRYSPEAGTLHSYSRENLKSNIYHNVFVYYGQSLRIDGGVSEYIRDVGNAPASPKKPGFTLALNRRGGTPRPTQSLKPSVVLLMLYYKQTVTAIVPLPSDYCNTGSGSHTHRSFL
jgi:hypothetical protein